MKEIQLLNGIWKCKSDPEELGALNNYFGADFNDDDWYDIKVPGHWQDEVEELKDYSGTVWYRTKFKVPNDFLKDENERVRLLFKGIFYKSEYYLNGEFLGTHEGYFDTHGYEVGDMLVKGDDKANVLAVKVICENEPDMNNKKQIIGTFGHWDASDPNFNAGGIWNDVLLYKSGNAYIERLKLITKLKNENMATEKISIFLDSAIDAELKGKISFTPHNFQGNSYSQDLVIKVEKGKNKHTFELPMKNPALWWTWDLGKPNLYDVKLELIMNNQITDELKTRTGIKEFKNNRKQYGLIKGEKWNIEFNKKRFFPKGTNIPPWQHLATGNKEKFSKRLQMLIDANMNIIRVHAHIDRDELHQACDELGILIWQDLPLQWFYAKSKFDQAKLDAKRAVQKIQHHPSQAIWCAHNEPIKFPNAKEILKMVFFILLSSWFTNLIRANLLGPLMSSWTGIGLKIVKEIIFIIIWLVIYNTFGILLDLEIPSLIAYNSNRSNLDPQLHDIMREEEENQNMVIPYSGICKGGVWPMFSTYAYTDIHAYPGWYASYFKGYRGLKKFLKPSLRNHARFVTEYGSQALPSKGVMFRILEPAERWPLNWKKLAKKHRCQPMFCKWWFPPKMAKNLEEYIELSQDYQAEQVHMQTEIFRRLKHNPMEGLITFLGYDCFPAVDWSFIDIDLKPKKAYYTVQKAFEPLYAFLDKWPKKKYKPGDIFESDVFLTNDYLEDKEAVSVQWKLSRENKNIIRTGDFKTKIKADMVKKIGKIEFKIPEENLYEDGEHHEIYLSISTLNPSGKRKVINNTYRIDINKYKWPH
ncbi:MAG: hypothetical protein GF364_12665 [Candidatus Lokiarchaeota archaeon]|nr:hypothetical protein [Candidatus Lokiarchaeota archaeon]